MDSGVTSTIVSKLRPFQKVNHYHGMSCLSRKNYLGKNLMKIHKALPEEYDFIPQTWLLPAEWCDFKSQFTGTGADTFILKPEALSQGKGIFLVSSWEKVNTAERYIAQRYVTNPYLIEGLKFDLRIYVLIYGCDPLRIFLYKEGLARLATEQYVPPDSKNMENLYMHLTNYAINKNNENFVFNTDPTRTDVGHKRSLTFVWKYIDEHGGDSKALRERIKACLIKTVCAVQPLLKHSYRTSQPNDYGNNKCFEVLGFDILLDQDLKPWLLEVNHSPSFTTDTPFDHQIKFDLLTDVLNIVKLDPMKHVKYHQRKPEVQQSAEGGKRTREETAELRQRKMDKRDKYELEHCGGFTRIYPDSSTEKIYEQCIKVAQQVWDEAIGTTRGKEMLRRRTEMQEKKKRREIKTHSQAKVPTNRKPLYYLNPSKVVHRQKVEAPDISAIAEVLSTYGCDPQTRLLVLRSLCQATGYKGEFALEEFKGKEEEDAAEARENILGLEIAPAHSMHPASAGPLQSLQFTAANSEDPGKGLPQGDVKAVLQRLQVDFPQFSILSALPVDSKGPEKSACKKAKQGYVSGCLTLEL